MDYQDINIETIERWISENDWEWGRPIDHETYLKALNGEWSIFLTPTKPVPKHWLNDLKGKKVLGLASGGGQQIPILTALGAKCTVFDYSKLQLDTERKVAEREGYEISIVHGDMSKNLPFKDEEFDLILLPIADCYIREMKPVWKECFRILKHEGTLLSGVDHFINFIVDENEKEIINHLPFDPLVDPEQRKQLEKDSSGMQFSHSLEELINGQLEAGFILKELYEDTNGEGRLHELNIPTSLAMCSLKP